MEEKKKRKLNLSIFYFISLLYLEFAFKVCMSIKLIKYSNIAMCAFLLFLAVLFKILTKIFNEKVNKIIFYTLLTIFGVWFSAQFIVKSVFDFYISLSVLSVADQVGGFFLKETIRAILIRIAFVIVFFVPLIMGIVLRKKLNFNKASLGKSIISIILMALFFGGYMFSLNIGKNKSYSPYKLFYKVNIPSLNIEKMGIMNTISLDIYRSIFGFEESIVMETEDEEEKDLKYEYNNLKIDFDSFNGITTDSTIKMMNEYFKGSKGTLQNEYTNFFENKNLIVFMAESFNEIAVREDITPTLYKIANKGFVFEDFYTITNQSTLGGEFQELTGLFANSETLPAFRQSHLSFPMGLATVFKNKGYNTYAYHDHSFTFQNRNDYLKDFGFENFKGCRSGMETIINCNLWPESDVEMIEGTFDEYANSDKPFMTFYASVSGHGAYTWMGNMMSAKHKEEVIDLGYSDNVAAYLASQIEFNDAIELLINKLKEAGKLDDTVIVIAGDHYPYMLTTEEMNEASDYEKDGVIEINHSNLIIYNSKMKKVNVSKVTSQVDILPTIYNLFGIDYDSRLIIGNDALSTAEGIAYFPDRSWVTNKGKYFAGSGTFEGDADEEYIDKINTTVSNRINMSKYLMKYNYYSLIWPYVK